MAYRLGVDLGTTVIATASADRNQVRGDTQPDHAHHPDTEAEMSNPLLSPPTIPIRVVAERCDRCGARAQSRAVLPSGGVLLFCGHHGRRLRSALVERGAVVRPAR